MDSHIGFPRRRGKSARFNAFIWKPFKTLGCREERRRLREPRSKRPGRGQVNRGRTHSAAFRCSIGVYIPIPRYLYIRVGIYTIYEGVGGSRRSRSRPRPAPLPSTSGSRAAVRGSARGGGPGPAVAAPAALSPRCRGAPSRSLSGTPTRRVGRGEGQGGRSVLGSVLVRGCAPGSGREWLRAPAPGSQVSRGRGAALQSYLTAG